MENTLQAKQSMASAKNVCVIPNQNNPEAVCCALALFYTLKDLDKNVNLVMSELPQSLISLAPSLDHITSPKNFVISIPKKTADIAQIYYEKTDEALKIHLTANRGNIKKEDVSFYFSNPKPDLTITIGIQNFKSYVQDKLDSCGFLLESDILNIDNEQKNEKFGKINLIGDMSLEEILMPVIDLTNKEAASCLLSGLALRTEGFKNNYVTARVFEAAAELMKKGASLKT